MVKLHSNLQIVIAQPKGAPLSPLAVFLLFKSSYKGATGKARVLY